MNQDDFLPVSDIAPGYLQKESNDQSCPHVPTGIDLQVPIPRASNIPCLINDEAFQSNRSQREQLIDPSKASAHDHGIERFSCHDENDDTEAASGSINLQHKAITVRQDCSLHCPP